MANPAITALDACRQDLFTSETRLRELYPDDVAAKVMRVREMYTWLLSKPDTPDKLLVEAIVQAHGISRVTAYSDLSAVKALLPQLSEASRAFHRWRYNEMILDTYRQAQEKGDVKTMEKAATSYAKHNRIDQEDEQQVPYELIVVQPFTATSDPRTLGIEPIPDLKQKIRAMIEKYRAETLDIDDVEYEEVDLEMDSLFPSAGPETSPS